MTRDERSQEESRAKDEAGAGETTASRGPKAGARLKAARQARSISLDEVARELHLDADKLRALEANRFEVFSAPVFSKGYLRRYAGLVGVPEDEVLAGFDELSGTDGPPPVVIKAPQAGSRFVPSVQALLLVLLACLLGLLGWWVFSGAVLKPVQEVSSDDARAPVLPPAGEDAPAEAAATVAAVPTSLPAEATVDETAADRAAAEETPVPATDAVGSAAGQIDSEPSPPAPAEVALTLSFTDECWLQVTDGDGERLYAGIARGGQVRRFSAVPPVSLVLGNADVASIEVDGEPYPINPADRRGRTARITVPGS